MATSILVERDLSAGERLLAELDRDGFPIIAAFWRYPTEEIDWRLVIVSPRVDQEGSLPVYQQVQTALSRLRGVLLFLSEIVVVGAQDPVVRWLRENLPPDFIPENFSISLRFPMYMPFASYLSEHELGVSLYVYRLSPEPQNRMGTAASVG